MHRFALALMLGTAAIGPACSKEQQQPTTTSPATTTASEPLRATARLPTIVLPLSVPAEAAGVVVVRSPESLYATFATLDLLGPANPADVAAMRAEIDGLLRSRVGMTLTLADRATAFFTAKEGVAVVLQGATGSPRGTAAGEVAGVPLFEVDGATLAVHDGELVIGERAAVVLAITTATGGHGSLRGSGHPLADAIARHSEGATLVGAVDVAQLPNELRREAATLGVEQAMLSYGDDGIRVAAYGSPASLERLRAVAVRALDEVAGETERAYAQALRGEEVWTAVAAILSHHQWKQAYGRLVPTLEGGRLGLHVPVRFDDPMVLAAFAGMAAAIAIPSLTKYMRRSKTSEARVGLAQLFDGVGMFFNEEQLRTGKVKVRGESKAAHRCPSDGRLVGQAGPTPPLSLRCSEGPGGKCVPVRGTPDGPGEYSMDLWLDDPVWRELGFVWEEPHAFHYAFRWSNAASGFGACQFTVQAFGDLDDDGLFSTYERAGAADELGMNAAAGLYIDQEVE